MKQEFELTASIGQFLRVVVAIQDHLNRRGGGVIDIENPKTLARFPIEEITDPTEYDKCQEARIIIESAELSRYSDVGVVEAKGWDGEKSRLIMKYHEEEDLENGQDIWRMFEKRFKQNGWKLTTIRNLCPVGDACHAFHVNPDCYAHLKC